MFNEDNIHPEQEAEGITRLLMASKDITKETELEGLVMGFIRHEPKRVIQLLVVLLGNMSAAITPNVGERDGRKPERIILGGKMFDPETKEETGKNVRPVIDYMFHLLEHYVNGEFVPLYNDLFTICEEQRLVMPVLAATMTYYPKIIRMASDPQHMSEGRFIIQQVTEDGVETVLDEGDHDLPQAY